MDRIQIQASKLQELIFSKDTVDTYQNTLTLTGNILKETAQLIWLIICSVFVFGAWVSNVSVKTGRSIRDWVDNKGSGGDAVDSKPLAETGKDLLDTAGTGITYILNQAREQLGLEAEEPIIEAAPKKSTATAATTTTSQPARSSAQSYGSSASASSTTSSAPSASSPSPSSTSSSSSSPSSVSSDPSVTGAPSGVSDEITREPVEDEWGSGEDS